MAMQICDSDCEKLERQMSFRNLLSKIDRFTSFFEEEGGGGGGLDSMLTSTDLVSVAARRRGHAQRPGCPTPRLK
jgi:hypothetical protein